MRDALVFVPLLFFGALAWVTIIKDIRNPKTSIVPKIAGGLVLVLLIPCMLYGVAQVGSALYSTLVK